MVTAGEQELERVASAFGIATQYWDQTGHLRHVPTETVRAVLGAFGIEARTDAQCQEAIAARQDAHWDSVLPPIHVMRLGDAQGPWLHHAEGESPLVWVELHGGGRRYDVVVEATENRRDEVVESRVLLPPDLPKGWHQLHVQHVGGTDAQCSLVVAPRRLPEVPRGWGMAVQLYSVRSTRSWGLGDLSDLSDIGVWAATDLGASYILVNPLHATAPALPVEDSPYLPTTRRFGNPLYIRPEAIIECAYLDRADRQFVAELAEPLRLQNRSPDLLDRDAVWTAKVQALTKIFAVPRSPARAAAFTAFVDAEGDDLRAFARWSALAERYGQRWDQWPPEAADTEPDPERVEFFTWLQWIFDEQLETAQRLMTEAGMSIGIVQDLAIGVDPYGADTWNLGDLLTPGFRVGAPPDMYNQLGQDWTQPPWNPQRLAEVQYRPLRDILRYVVKHAGGLRIDHIIGLFRLWWIPPGADPTAGTYVRYDHQAIIDILCLEAETAGVALIGEDLGTVEPWAREVMAERGILGTTVLLFERRGDKVNEPAGFRPECLASVTVHDLPPTMQYLAGDHWRLRDSLGLLTETLDEALAGHEHEIEVWVRALQAHGLLPTKPPISNEQITEALHRLLARAPSRMLCLSLVDGVGDMRTQNQPGTDDEYPNWRIPLCDAEGRVVLVEDLPSNAMVRRLARALSR